MIKKVSPGNVAPVTGVRKAMGIAPVPPQQISSNSYATHYVSMNVSSQPEILSIFFSIFDISLFLPDTNGNCVKTCD